jgi:deoxycytidylate deaminase
MDDDGTRKVDFQSHKFYRLIFDQIRNHPFKKNLTALHGSLITKGGSVISWGLNEPGKCGFSESYAYHPGFTRHAELNAIKKVRRKIDLTGAVCYNLRIDKNGEIRMSKPCPSCEKLLLNYGFKKVYFSTENGFMDCMKLSSLRLEMAA